MDLLIIMCYLYTLLLLLLAICGAQAQEAVEIYDDATQEDSLMVDTFAVERHALSWVVKHKQMFLSTSLALVS